MSIVDSGVVIQRVTKPEELPNPVEGQPLSAALKYFFDHTSFDGELKKVLDYAMTLAASYEADMGERAVITPKPFGDNSLNQSNPNEILPQFPIEHMKRDLPQATRDTTDPHGLQLPRNNNPFNETSRNTRGMTTSESLYAGDPKEGLPPVFVKPTLGANPNPSSVSGKTIAVETGGDATDPRLAAEIERQNKISPAERFKMPATDSATPVLVSSTGQPIVPEADDPF